MAGRREHTANESIALADDKAAVLEAMNDLVGAGLAMWSVSGCGDRYIHFVGGDVFVLEAACVRRLR
jgi:hypothetical protein